MHERRFERHVDVTFPTLPESEVVRKTFWGKVGWKYFAICTQVWIMQYRQCPQPAFSHGWKPQALWLCVTALSWSYCALECSSSLQAKLRSSSRVRPTARSCRRR